MQVKKRPEGEDSVESDEKNYVDVARYSPPNISQYTSHEVEELLQTKAGVEQCNMNTSTF